ncbi:tetratricopeptide repeat protein [Persicobacter psychrovividus]|uniref:Tetratricopeptide repeat protein n=1 Tax=Persicobacter psychrovividus TaxID=387638 RepID=A0ABN6L3U2_9BACT|nr:hypothetical protein PEPS_00070 [Persicobacter psychrovividus]
MWKTSLAFKILGFTAFLSFGILSSQAQDFQKVSIAEEYLGRGEIEKAEDIYEKLARNNENLPLIHKPYLDLLFSTKNFKQAEKYLNRAIKKNPEDMIYQVDRGRLYESQGEMSQAEKYFNNLIDDQAKDLNNLRNLAQEFYRAQEFDWAELTFLKGRKVAKNEGLFAHELANIYRMTNQKDKMVNEYVQMAVRNPKNRSYVKNVLQSALTDEEDLEAFESYLIDRIQKDGKEAFYPEMLIWANMQQRNFYGAFVQARSLDKRSKSNGDYLMNVAQMALRHQDYEHAVMAYDYVIEHYQKSPNYFLARNAIIKAREEQVKNTYPVEMNSIDELISSYEKLITEVPTSQTTLEAKKNKAMLHALYKGEYDIAINLLESVVGQQKVSKQLKLECKIALGDIYLLKDEPWESRLLYAQAEKEGRETPIGYDAKLRSAKLSYYTGDFKLAAAHLDVLKLATTREIANDAMSLSLLIKDNTALDSTETAMKTYAAIDLLLFQHKNDQALAGLKKMLTDFRGHSLQDEIHYLMAEVYKKQGSFPLALEHLQKVIDLNPADIKADDAMFEKAKIYEIYLKEKQAAMETYELLMKNYPGSIHVDESRKRFRALRGDFPN